MVGGFCELGADGLLYNSAAVVDGTGVLAVYRKIHLWDRESLFFEPGTEPAPVVETSVGRIGVGVCYDLNFPEVARGLALAGADLLALPANFPLHPRPEGERPIEVTNAHDGAPEPPLRRGLRPRPERGVEWVVERRLRRVRLAARRPAARLRPGARRADCDFDRARDKAWNERNDVLGDRRPELYRLRDAAS